MDFCQLNEERVHEQDWYRQGLMTWASIHKSDVLRENSWKEGWGKTSCIVVVFMLCQAKEPLIYRSKEPLWCNVLYSWILTEWVLPQSLQADHLASNEPPLLARRGSVQSISVYWSMQWWCFSLRHCVTLPTPPLTHMISRCWRRNWPMSWWAAITWHSHNHSMYGL